MTAEEVANAVLIERKPDATPAENIDHYANLAETLKGELAQVGQTAGEEGEVRYRFEPNFAGVNPRQEFASARDDLETNQRLEREAWEHLLALDTWQVRTRQMTIDLAGGVGSLFKGVALPPGAPRGEKELAITWHGRQITGGIRLLDLAQVAGALPAIDSAALAPAGGPCRDFAVIIAARPVPAPTVVRLQAGAHDPRLIIWTPAELTAEERGRLLDFAAYRQLINLWQGKDSEDALAVINWVYERLQRELGRIAAIVRDSYGRGSLDASGLSNLSFTVAGDLASILTPVIGRVLDAIYQSRAITFSGPVVFRDEEAVKVVNGIVKTGSIPKGAKPDQNVSAAQNFALGLQIVRRGAEKELDTADNPFVRDFW
ncbi:MAG TPA: hypothetical protein VIU62_09385, partial [Chloroflexota bacterium]